jgi:hypothetical protein
LDLGVKCSNFESNINVMENKNIIDLKNTKDYQIFTSWLLNTPKGQMILQEIRANK